MRVGSLCTGYGGIEMGLRLAGVEVDLRWFAEIDADVARLNGEAPNLGDITVVDWSDVDAVDLLTAGFPCQPVSAAGAQLGENDPRWLWPAVRDAVAALAPQQVLIENVRNLISTRKGELWRGILGDLHGLGYRVRWLTLGACHVGAAHHRHRVFALATRGTPGVEHVQMSFCGAKGGAVLPTPAARDGDGRGEGDPAYWGAKRRTNGIPLGAELALLPTPQSRDGQGRGTAARFQSGRRNIDDTLALLPTPQARDAGGGVKPVPAVRTHDGTDHGPCLRDVAPQLLPTPRATVDPIGGPGQRGRRGDLAMPSAVQPQHWGRFAEAVARHEERYGPAPAPTEPNRNGAPRLAPAFAEWLMCLPAGHVTDKLDRTPALRAIGNGVCPPQLAAAWRELTR